MAQMLCKRNAILSSIISHCRGFLTASSSRSASLRNLVAPVIYSTEMAPLSLQTAMALTGVPVSTAALALFSRANTTSAAYPPPSSPGEFQGEPSATEEPEADPEYPIDDEGPAPFDPTSMLDYGANNEDEESEYVEEEPEPDPEADALYSPSEDD